MWLWKPEVNTWNYSSTPNQLHIKKGLPVRSQKVRINCTHRRFFHPHSLKLKTTQKWSKYPQEYFLQNHFCICNFRGTEEKSGKNLLSYSPLVRKKLFPKEMCPRVFFWYTENKSYNKKIHLGQYLLGKPALHPALKGEAAVQRSQVSSSTSLQADRTNKSRKRNSLQAIYRF